MCYQRNNKTCCNIILWWLVVVMCLQTWEGVCFVLCSHWQRMGVASGGWSSDTPVSHHHQGLLLYPGLPSICCQGVVVMLHQIGSRLLTCVFLTMKIKMISVFVLSRLLNIHVWLLFCLPALISSRELQHLGHLAQASAFTCHGSECRPS